MIEERKKLEAIREELRNFIGTYVHTEFVAATTKDLRSVEERILEDELTTVTDFFTLLDLRGRRAVLKANLTSFEDTVANLDDRIAQMKRDEETPNAAQQEIEEDNEQD